MTADAAGPEADAVLAFWFDALGPRQWFAADAATDRLVGERFGATWRRAAACELWSWRATARGRLAEIIVLDQFSREIHRATARAFAQDPLALALAQELVAAGLDSALSATERHFAYMPYMHSESLIVHDEAARLFAGPGLEAPLRHEREHRTVLERFGRYPQRNAALGRETTEAEAAFLADDPPF